MSDAIDITMMRLALQEAENAALSGEVPIGAVLVRDNVVIAKAANLTRTLKDPTAHAEILCIREACKNDDAQRIPDTTLYVTLEPCAMCAAAIAFARISRLVIGARDHKGGGVFHGGRFFEQPTCHHKISIKDGILAEESGEILKKFFAVRR